MNIFGHKFAPKGPKLVLKNVFCHFFKFGSLVFLEIAYSDSLQQCITSSRGKTHKKDWGGGANLGQKRPKLGSILGFPLFSQV